jgi:hypothetical protein
VGEVATARPDVREAVTALTTALAAGGYLLDATSGGW